MQQIKTRWPALQLIGVDIAPAMIEKSRTRLSDSKLLVADIEQTGLPDESTSTVFSCAAMQWCNPARAIAEAARLLKPGGQFLMTTFVSDSLPEFRKAWHRVSSDLNRVHDLASESNWQTALLKHDFQIKTQLQTQAVPNF